MFFKQLKFKRLDNLPKSYTWYERFWANLVYTFVNLPTSAHHCKIDVSKYKKLKKLAQPGDVLLMGTKGRIGELILRSPLSHSGLILDDLEVIHSTFDGVSKDPIAKILSKYDKFVLLRSKRMSKTRYKKFKELTMKYLGHAYDFKFKIDVHQKFPKAFYCTELVDWAFRRVGIKLFHNSHRHYIKPAEYLDTELQLVLTNIENIDNFRIV